MGLFEPLRGVDGKGFFLRRDGLASRAMSYTFHLLPPRATAICVRRRLPSATKGPFLPSMRRRRL